ncbi:MAG: ATP-binding protein [Paracoccaceae bacterium]
MAPRIEPSESPSQLLGEAIDALSEGIAVFDDEAVLCCTNAGFREMNPCVADILDHGPGWNILLREWVGRGGISAAARERLDWMEARLGDGDGSPAPLEVDSQGRVHEIFLQATAKGGFVLVQKDITARRRAEESEREADMLLRKVLEACPANIVMSRVGDGEIIYRTPAATELLGTARHTHGHFASREERADFITALLPDGRVADMPVTGLRPDGTRFPCLVSARLIDYRDEDVIVSTTVDISKEVALRQKLAEQREQIFQAEKMSALGELLAGIAHELNNPLSVVVGHALMLRDEEIDPATLRHVEKISDAAERCAKIVKSFLAMARQQPARLVPIDIADTLEMSIDALRNGAEGIATPIECEVAPDLPPVRGDMNQIAQVLINLVANADQAIRDSGTGDLIRITVRHDAPEEMIEIAVADNGPGIPREIRSRIFDPLFTTKPVGAGTGIGLALCQRVVTAHSGQIGLQPASGQGATIVVRLPVTNAERSSGVPEAEPRATNKGRVLVADDEADVCELLRELLVKDGFEVETADTAEKALSLIETGDFAFILSDLKMPGMGGRGLYERLLRDRPALARRLGFVTGDTMSAQARGFLDGSGRPFLEKPIAPSELRALVQTISGESDGEGTT